MNRLLAAGVLSVALAGAVPDSSAATADDVLVRDGYDIRLEDYIWTHRPVLLFADSRADPRFNLQLKMIQDDIEALRERDVVVFTDTDPAANSALRLQLRPRGFMLALVGKDGSVKMRKPLPWNMRELTRVIDKMPMRQQEIRDRRGG